MRYTWRFSPSHSPQQWKHVRLLLHYIFCKCNWMRARFDLASIRSSLIHLAYHRPVATMCQCAFEQENRVIRPDRFICILFACIINSAGLAPSLLMLSPCKCQRTSVAVDQLASIFELGRCADAISNVSPTQIQRDQEAKMVIPIERFEVFAESTRFLNHDTHRIIQARRRSRDDIVQTVRKAGRTWTTVNVILM